MPDTTRTVDARLLSAVQKQLQIVAQKTGLLPAQIALFQSRAGRLSDLFRLPHVSEEPDDVGGNALALVHRIEESIKRLPSFGFTECAELLFGVQLRHRELPYEQRRGNAIARWDPDERRQPETFTRRVLPAIREELALVCLDPANDYSLPTDVGMVVGTASEADTAYTYGLHRLEFRGETWLSGEDQRAVFTDWTFKDRVTKRDVIDTVIRTRHGAYARVEPRSDIIESVKSCGVDHQGYQIWRVTFADRLVKGDVIEWTTRRLFGPPRLAMPTPWLSHTPSTDYAFDSGEFIAHLDKRYLPSRVARFVTPKGSLPNLEGRAEDIPIPRNGVVRTTFRDLEPFQTHGIRWWPAFTSSGAASRS